MSKRGTAPKVGNFFPTLSMRNVVWGTQNATAECVRRLPKSLTFGTKRWGFGAKRTSGYSRKRSPFELGGRLQTYAGRGADARKQATPANPHLWNGSGILHTQVSDGVRAGIARGDERGAFGACRNRHRDDDAVERHRPSEDISRSSVNRFFRSPLSSQSSRPARAPRTPP
jgi:hypothetical protein